MDYTFMRRDLHFPKIAGKLLFLGPRMKIDSLECNTSRREVARVAGHLASKGRAGPSGRTMAGERRFCCAHKTIFQVRHLQRPAERALCITGKGDDPKSMRGQGQLAVTEGQVFAIPFLSVR